MDIILSFYGLLWFLQHWKFEMIARQANATVSKKEKSFFKNCPENLTLLHL